MKMKDTIQSAFIAIAVICSGVAMAYENVEYTTSIVATPGTWNTNFANSLAYAQQNHIPVIMYYGVYGCTYAEKGVKALNQQVLKDWFAENNIVMIYKRVSTKLVNKILSNKNADYDLWLGREWVKNGTSVANYPIMRIYWNKSDGTVVSKTFSMRYKQMPVTTPAGSDPEDLAGQLLGTLKKYLADYVPGEVVPSVDDDESSEEEKDAEPSESDEEESQKDSDDNLALFGTKLLTYKGYIASGDDLLGVVTLSAKKTTAAGIVNVSGKVTTIAAKNYSFSSKTTIKDHSIELKDKNLGSIGIVFSDDAFIGTIDGCIARSSEGIGGNLPVGTAHFMLDDTLPETNGTYTIIHGALPTNEVLTVSAAKMKAGRAGSVKWNSKNKNLVISEVNPAALALKYTSSSGLFTGAFKIYQSKYKINAKTGSVTGMALSKLTASVTGFVVDGVGYGQATVKGFDEPFDVEIRFDEEDTE